MKCEIQIPNEHHKFILGKGGNNLKQLESETGTKINIPKNDDVVIITGIKEDVERACHEIQSISDRKVSRFHVIIFQKRQAFVLFYFVFLQKMFSCKFFEFISGGFVV